VRWGLVFGNLALLALVSTFVVTTPHGGIEQKVVNSASAESNTATNPLDQLSAAAIAVNVARLGKLPEATAVANQADSVSTDMAIAPASTDIVSKPQVVSTTLKSRNDIQHYTTRPGDTVSAIAAKFGVTSDSIRWSNGLSGDNVAVNQQLLIPPVNGIVYVVKAGDTPDALAAKFRANKDRIVAANDAEMGGLRPGEQILIPDGTQPAPVVTRAVSSYSGGGGGFAWGSTPVYGGNGYDYGWCTWYVSNRRAELGRPVPNNLGDARTWYRAAQQAGLPTGLSPQVGAVMVNEGGNHVAVVEQVNSDGTYWISEMNSHGQVSMTNSTPTGGWSVRDYKIQTRTDMKFIY
jgi:LysM repeat protein